MCELLNRIWSRPRGEWTRVLRKELPALAAGIVEELRDGLPEFSTLVEDLGDEAVRQQVEAALLTVLGYRESVTPASGADAAGPAPDQEPTPDHQRVPDHQRIPKQRDDEPGARPQRPALTAVPAQGSGNAPERARRELFAALTGDMAMADAALGELAEAAHWPLPATVRAIVPATPGEPQQLAAVLDDALAGMVGGQPCLLVPSPEPDARGALEAVLRGRCAAVGHPVPLRDTASSLRWALRLLALTPIRAGLDARAVFVDDHLSTLLLLQDEPLAHALAARWLRPLNDLTPRQSERLEVTLLAWLEGGGAPEAAKALSVHPQTVRYRMRQLEKLFGPGLRDPRTRFELEMALRSRRLMAQVRRQHSRVGRRARTVAADFRPLDVMARVNGL
ncbi:helix-turn-helix domain-containing protein [Streptomyces sp. NBC_00536]|uniref:PucR family transcriptional regulator n=1 Tax=Streptomyces sp. NBC_00536 TaxID=2975769 RepID=UPI002E802FFE|nr:helix-turn-helix domain-containing protein [Streptomyces sp. NBC_00536]WUC82427.1 helix-turn-helix domain-containing protein [Streptomyces sp. NBC_00536]